MARIRALNGEDVPFTPEEEAEADAREAAEVALAGRRSILQQIAALEAKENPRRLAEAVLSAEGRTWLENNRAQIAALRAQLGS